MKKRVLTLFLTFVLSISCTGCDTKTAKCITGDRKANPVIVESPKENDMIANQFALELFKASFNEEGNTLISPFSVLCALAITANGAKAETLEQMEQALGMKVEQLNQSIFVYRNDLPKEKDCNVALANSIWFTDHIRFTVNEDFLQTNADYHGAEIYEAPFDQSTVADINQWVRENTDGMIPSILDKIPASAIMYLINALTFDAEWMDLYQKSQMDNGIFTREDGVTESVEYMRSGENWYLEDDYATGVMKHYKGAKYAFAALLPEKGMSIKEYMNTLTGDGLYNIFENVQNVPVTTKIPKFETEYEISLVEPLAQMGMDIIFDGSRADFTGLGISEEGNIFVSEVLHKSFIAVDERGTKAGAVTMVETADGCIAERPIPKEVILDRPFVYMIVDLENQIPLFMGALMTTR